MKAKSTSTSQKFNSLHEFAAWINSAPVHKSFIGNTASIDGTKNFCGTASYEEADNLMLNGWNNGAKEIKKSMLKISTFEAKKDRHIKINYIGAVPCIPAYLSGSPAYMITIKKKQTSKPVITLFYNSSVSFSVDAKDITAAAAKLMQAIQEIETAGVGVTLWCGSVRESSRCSEKVANAVKIKDSREPFNLLNVAYPLTHPSFNRRHAFAFVERCGGDSKTWRGYGYAVTNAAIMHEELENLNISTDICLTYYDLENKTKDEILTMLKNACEKRQF